jgi:hypothetical protein
MTEYNIAATGKNSIAAHTIAGSVSTGDPNPPLKAAPNPRDNSIMLETMAAYFKRYSPGRATSQCFIVSITGEVRMDEDWAMLVVDEATDDMFLLERNPGRARVKVSAYNLDNIGFVRD